MQTNDIGASHGSMVSNLNKQIITYEFDLTGCPETPTV